jgi:para-nitrobenzyl esterase
MNKMDRRSFLGQSSLAAGLLITGSKLAQAAKTDGGGIIGNTQYGKIKGAREGKTLTFRGVPYGASTDGKRFLPPAKHAGWTGVRDALETGRSSPQIPSTLIPESMAQQPKGDANGSEDCLNLNVFTNALSGKRPVMVWFHGGGYSAGSANWKMYDGTNLAAKHDVVVVTVTHRLNVFGYLHLAGLGGAQFAESANVGMLDCVQALQWVKDNISNFGGDPNNVTIFGQSGGGGKVSTLLGMAPAKGLFHRAIMMSGSNPNGQPQESANRGVEALLTTLNLSKSDVAKLQSLPAMDLMKAMRATRGLTLSPVVDGKTLPAGPFNPVASPLSASVPLMLGSTETEITWNAAYKGEPIDEAELRNRVKNIAKIDDAACDKLLAVYRKTRADWKPLQLWNLMGSDFGGARNGTNTQVERRAAASGQAPVYKYYFQWYSPVNNGIYGSYHTLDIPFAFRTCDIAESMCGNGKDRYALEDKMSAAWAAFARTGNPNTKLLPKWEPFTNEKRATMILNNECKHVEDPFKEERLARANMKTNENGL